MEDSSIRGQLIELDDCRKAIEKTIAELIERLNGIGVGMDQPLVDAEVSVLSTKNEILVSGPLVQMSGTLSAQHSKLVVNGHCRAFRERIWTFRRSEVIVKESTVRKQTRASIKYFQSFKTPFKDTHHGFLIAFFQC
jgi:hypothetical protein